MDMAWADKKIPPGVTRQDVCIWRPATSAHAAVVNALMALTDEQRMDVFGFFCTHCGGNDPRCQCWNDE